MKIITQKRNSFIIEIRSLTFSNEDHFVASMDESCTPKTQNTVDQLHIHALGGACFYKQ